MLSNKASRKSIFTKGKPWNKSEVTQLQPRVLPQNTLEVSQLLWSVNI